MIEVSSKIHAFRVMNLNVGVRFASVSLTEVGFGVEIIL